MGSRSGSGWILVVDDNHLLRTSLCECLQMAGFAAVGAADRREAKRLVETFTPDVVLVDVLLEDALGMEVVDELARLQERSFATVFMSGLWGHELERRGLLPEGSMLLEKPFRSTDVVQAIRDALERRAGRCVCEKRSASPKRSA